MKKFMFGLSAVPFLCMSCLVFAAPKLFGQSTTTFQSTVNAIGLNYAGGKGFVLQNSYQLGSWDGTQPSYWKLTASDDAAMMVRIRAFNKMNEEKAKKTAAEEYARLDFLFEGWSAYPGMITGRYKIANDLEPYVIANSSSDYKIYILYSTKEMAYGVGSRDQAVYRSSLTFRYCKKIKTLIEVELFVPRKRFDQKALLQELDNFSCKE